MSKDKRNNGEEGKKRVILKTRKEFKKAINLFLDKDINLLIPPRNVFKTHHIDYISHVSQVPIHHTHPQIIHPNIERLLLRTNQRRRRNEGEVTKKTTPVRESTKNMNLNINFVNK